MEPTLLAFLEGPDLAIVVVIVLLVFGGSQLPKLARSLGQAQREFQKGLREGVEGGPEVRGGGPDAEGADPGQRPSADTSAADEANVARQVAADGTAVRRTVDPSRPNNDA